LLHFREMKVCWYCRQLKPQADFKSLGSRSCAACRISRNQDHGRHWREQNRKRRRAYMTRYMAGYRGKKNAALL